MSFNDFTNTIKLIWSYTAIRVVVVVIATLIINSVIKSIVKKLFKPKTEPHVRNKQLVQKSRETASRVILTVINLIIWISAILIIFSLLNIETSSILAGAGFFGLIIGLGTKSLIESLVIGFFLIADGNISIGDYVRINDFNGIVHDISVRNITLRSNTGELNIIPVTNIKDIINYSMDLKKVLVNIVVPVEQDFIKVMNKINSCIKEMDYVDTLTDIQISGYNLYKDNYEIRVECEAVEGTNLTVQSLIKNEILKALSEEEIKIEV